MTTAAMSEASAPAQTAGPLGTTSWMLFDWAQQPFYTLVTTFLFAPYFSAYFVQDVSWGAALWGYTQSAAAIIVALGAPFLGAIADKSGRLKRLIFFLSIGFVLGQLALWYAEPGATQHLWFILLALIVATVTAEFTAVLNNSLMPRIVRPEQLGRVSGGGWALGYVGGLISLIFMASFVQMDEQTGRTIFGFEPIWAFDMESREADRIVGPFTALWYVIFVIPFFLFTPDAEPKPGAGPVSLRGAFNGVMDTLSHIRRYRDIALFFIARMMFIDGLLAIFTFGGIYAVSVFGWAPMMVGYFGIILSVAAGIGAGVGGFLDDRLGSKNVVLGSLVILIVGAIGVISIDKTHVLFVFDVAPPQDGAAAFSSTGEMVYLAFALLIGLSGGPLQSASRSLLARMAPPEHMSEFFGFFAFSGKVTAFAAPLLIGIVSTATGSLQIAMSVILIFLLGGLVVMGAVRTPNV